MPRPKKSAKEKESWWFISIYGWGEMVFFDTEAQAEEQRAYKAQREGGVGRKFEIPKEVARSWAAEHEAQIGFAVKYERANILIKSQRATIGRLSRQLKKEQSQSKKEQKDVQ